MRSGSPQASAAGGVAPALRCDAGLSAHDCANGDLRWPAHLPSASTPTGEPLGSLTPS